MYSEKPEKPNEELYPHTTDHRELEEVPESNEIPDPSLYLIKTRGEPDRPQPERWYEDMDFGQLEKDPDAGPILQVEALTYLRGPDREWFLREYTGDTSAAGYLIRADGTESNVKPSQCIGGGRAMMIVAEGTRLKMQAAADTDATEHPGGETPIRDAHEVREASLAESSRTISEQLYAEAKRNALERSVRRCANFLTQESTINVPYDPDGDVCRVPPTDIAGPSTEYLYGQLFERLTGARMPVNNETPPGTSIVQGVHNGVGAVELRYEGYLTLSSDNIDTTVMHEAIADIAQAPPYRFLREVRDSIEHARGDIVEVFLPDVSERERSLILYLCGARTSDIEHSRNAREVSYTIDAIPGLSFVTYGNDKEALRYAPKHAAIEQTDKTFLASESGRAVANLLGREHLSPQLTHELSEGLLAPETARPFSPRYGNGFADLSRTLSVCIGRSREETYFTLFGDEQHAVSESDRARWQEAARSHKLASVRHFFTLLGQVCFEQYAPHEDVDIPSYPARGGHYSVRDGSCKDAETYYGRSDMTHLGLVDGVFMEKKGNGSQTALVVKPIRVGNVELPPGYLVRLARDEAGHISHVEPLRATMFMFDEEQAHDVFGWQYEETRAEWAQSRTEPLLGFGEAFEHKRDKQADNQAG